MTFKEMIDLSPFRIVAVCLLLLGTAACKSTESGSSAQTTDYSELEELYWQRINSSRMNFTEADVHFMTGMIAHHAQALIMSRLAPENGANAEVQRLAARIINAQRDEIETMQRWLRNRDQPVPEIHIDGLNLHVNINGEHSHHHMGMPGVLSQAQLEELSAAQNAEFDRVFLTYMIEHHAGAVVMVNNLFDTTGAAQDNEAFTLATSIQADQITEIERMKLMLESLADSAW